MRRTMAEDPSAFDPRAFLKAARSATRELCRGRYEAFGSAGWASSIKPVPLEVMAERYANA
jgi:fructose-bisphosphate aldolase class II